MQVELGKLSLSNATILQTKHYADGRSDRMGVTNINLTLTNLKERPNRKAWARRRSANRKQPCNQCEQPTVRSAQRQIQLRFLSGFETGRDQRRLEFCRF